MNEYQSKFARRLEEVRHTREISADDALQREVHRRSDVSIIESCDEGRWKDEATVMGEDLARFYALVEQAGQNEVRDLFTPAEAGALIYACGQLELNRVEPNQLSCVLPAFLEEYGWLMDWQASVPDILRKVDGLSTLGRQFLIWRLDEQSRLSGHRPTRASIGLVMEDIELKSRDWGENGWGRGAPRLFMGSVTVPEYEGYKDVEMTLVRDKRPRPVLAYDMLLGEYYRTLHDVIRVYVEGAVDELFTKREMDCVKAYVERQFGTEVAVYECNVPEDLGTMGLTARPLGGGPGCVVLGGARDRGLPFPIACVYDLRVHTPVGQSESEIDGTEQASEDEDPTS